MKKWTFTIGFLFLSGFLFSQTPAHKVGISFGFGFQQYKGDLGNGFLKFSPASYGVTTLNLSLWLNRSLDVALTSAIGDLGYCQPKQVASIEVPKEDRCPGCTSRPGLGNLNSRLGSTGLMLTYKFANGYILKETSRLSPFVFASANINLISDRMEMRCVNTGTYISIHSGLGLRYDLSDRLHIGGNLSMGFFTSDEVDFLSDMHKDLIMRNSVFLGVNL